MSSVLKKLSTKGSQVLVTTHSPYFVGGQGFEAVRLIRRPLGTGPANSYNLTFSELAQKLTYARQGVKPECPEGTLAKIQQELQPSINEIFFSPVLILVEGLEDLAYITTYIELLGQSEKFRRLGCNIVYTSGKSHLLQPLIISRHLGIPTFLVFDSDSLQPEKDGIRKKHEMDNAALLRAVGYPDESPMPAANIWKPDIVMWRTELGDEVKAEYDPSRLQGLLETVRVKYGQVTGLEKNVLFISTWLAAAWKEGLRSPLLERLCNSILSFAEEVAIPKRT